MGRWRSGTRYRRHRQRHRPQDFGLSRRPQRPGQPTGERPMSASDPDADSTTQDTITFEEMLAPSKADGPEAYGERSAADLEAVFDVPVRISVVLGRTKMAVSDLLR